MYLFRFTLGRALAGKLLPKWSSMERIIATSLATTAQHWCFWFPWPSSGRCFIISSARNVHICRRFKVPQIVSYHNWPCSSTIFTGISSPSMWLAMISNNWFPMSELSTRKTFISLRSDAKFYADISPLQSAPQILGDTCQHHGLLLKAFGGANCPFELVILWNAAQRTSPSKGGF